MRESLRRRMRSVQISVLVAGAGVAAALGIGQSAEPPVVEADAAKGQTLTINGTNIADGSVRLKDVRKKDFDSRYMKIHNFSKSWDAYLKTPSALAAFDAFLKLDGVAKMFDAFLKLDKLEAFDAFIKISSADARYYQRNEADHTFLKLDAASKDAMKLGGLPPSAYVKGEGQMAHGSRLVGDQPETAVDVPGLIACSFSWGVSNSGTAHIKNNSGKVMHFVVGGAAKPGSGRIEAGKEATFSVDATGPEVRVVQIIEGDPGDGNNVHTLTMSIIPVANDAGGAPVQAQMSAGILIGL